MLEHDISTADALRHLSIADRADGTDNTLNRRRFLQLVAMGVGGAALGGPLADLLAHEGDDVWAGPIGADDQVLVIVGLYGGNDALNTVVPYGTGQYYDYRPGFAIPPEQVLHLDDHVGLHPKLATVKAMYDAGQVAVVQGLGYPNPSLSHFASMATWMNGSAAGGPPRSGWIGRWLDQLAAPDLFTATTVGSSLPLHLVGRSRRGTAVPPAGISFGGRVEIDLPLYDGIRAFGAAPSGRGPWHDAVAQVERDQLDVARTLNPLFVDALPTSDIARALAIAARLINADLGVRVVDTGFGSFDTHANEPADHPALLADFDSAVAQFFASLSPQFASRVTLMTFSEFGRSPWSNQSGGTDHGTAGSHFLIGPQVKGGLYGQQHSLDGLAHRNQPVHTVDFRAFYASVLQGCLDADVATVLEGNVGALDLFRPRQISDPPVPTTANAGFVPITATRIVDTRSGLGAPAQPLGPGGTLDFAISGQPGLPATGVAAALLNITALSGATPSFFTVWPTGTTRPLASSLNIGANDVVPNLVAAMVGDGGRVSVFNSTGNVHCIVDVVGYFTNSGGSALVSAQPERVLDTRRGLGAPIGPVAAGGTIELAVGSALGGAVGATGTQAVVMNVTVTDPSAHGYLTVWPSGAPMPLASNLNFGPGQTVANLVVTTPGSAGSVSVFNAAGATQIIVDVLGYFSTTGGSRFTPLPPTRVLDTRNGGAAARVGDQQSLLLHLAGVDGIPRLGVSAVAINLTAVGATQRTFLTAYPSDQPRPIASNLNVDADETRANLVISKLGADGSVAIANGAGMVHLIADVVGYFA